MAGFAGGRPVLRSPEAGGRSARMKYSWIGPVITMAPFSLPACPCRSDGEGFGSQTGVAVIVPLVDPDQPFG